jgi:hypothetical protein
MAASVDQLVGIAVDRADTFAAAAAGAIAEIDGKRGTIGYTSFGVAPTDFVSAYTATPADTTPLPTYTPPNGTLPGVPILVDLPTIASPGLPTAPTINTTGLFTETLPSSVMPDWNEAAPDLHVEDIYNDLVNTAKPVLMDVNIPQITPINIGTPPALQLPSYEPIATPEAIPAPTNYADYMKAKYDAALPIMKSFIDDVVDGWVSKYAPEYYSQRDAINAKILAGMNNSILPDQFEAALYSRARARAEVEYKASEATTFAQGDKRGFIIPPGATVSALNKARIEGAKTLAGVSTDVYIERRKAEIQHLQFVMNLASTQMQQVRSLAVQYAQTGLGMIQNATTLSKEITDKLITVFEHEKSRHEFALAVMKALNDQYEVKLKAALSGLEGYKVSLEALKLRADVEFKQIEGAKIQVDVQQLQVQRYSAIIDAITKRASVEELRIKEYAVRAQVFETSVRARVAAFEAYKAAIEGDKAKLEGELSKLSIYEAQLKAVTLQVDVQKTILDADVKTNVAKITQYSAQIDAYKTTAEIALQKFTAEAEIKKLGLDVYKTNVEANLEVYKGALQKDIAFITARIEAFKGSVESLSNFYRLQQGYTELDLKKTEAIASGYSNMASAALQSLNSMVSLATTA